jgi:serine/threonine protein kinase
MVYQIQRYKLFLLSFLEYVPGGSVESCLRKHGAFGENVTKSFTEQILNGLEYIHSQNILHRVSSSLSMFPTSRVMRVFRT